MKFRRQLFFIILLSFYSHAYAHDPGFSTAIFTLNGDRLVATLTFSLDEINDLVLMDADQNGNITQVEFIAVQNKLKELANKSVLINVNQYTGAPVTLAPENISLTYSESNALIFVLQFILAENQESVIEFPIITRLSRGHRLYAVVRDSEDNQISQHILGSNNSTFIIKSIKPGQLLIFVDYIHEGVVHIWGGLDHLLFLLTLLLPSVMIYRHRQWQALDKLRPAIMDTLKIVTAFTLAHSITLFLAVMQLIILPVQLIESLIAFSVVLTALNNLYPVFKTQRWTLAFVFGLVHGFGFANALQGLNLQTEALATSLLGFNLGVELGQIIIILLFFPVIAFIRHTDTYRTWGLAAGSIAVLLIASVWVIERTLDVEIMRI